MIQSKDVHLVVDIDFSLITDEEMLSKLLAKALEQLRIEALYKFRKYHENNTVSQR